LFTGEKSGLLHLAKIYIQGSFLSFHNKTFSPSKNGFIQQDLKKEMYILEKFVKMEIIFSIQICIYLGGFTKRTEE
jgi:hypothetical protein